MMRDMTIVIDKMLEVIPDHERDLIQSLKEKRMSFLYCAPEDVGLHAAYTAEILQDIFPSPDALSEWQQKALGIWMGLIDVGAEIKFDAGEEMK